MAMPHVHDTAQINPEESGGEGLLDLLLLLRRTNGAGQCGLGFEVLGDVAVDIQRFEAGQERHVLESSTQGV